MYARPGGPGGVFPIRKKRRYKVETIIKDKIICSCGKPMEIQEVIGCFNSKFYLVCKCGIKLKF